MTNNEVLESFKPMVSFLAAFLGPACEIVLHDISHPEASAIAIGNGFNSGREIGSPLTSFAQDIIAKKKYKGVDFILNYTGTGKGNDFISSTFYIKNNGKLIGMLCINRNVRAMKNLSQAIADFQKQYNILEKPNSPQLETLDIPVDQLLHMKISSVINAHNLDPETMTIEERIQLVKELKKEQVFEMKGAVAETAHQLGVSIPTIYRYLNQ